MRNWFPHFLFVAMKKNYQSWILILVAFLSLQACSSSREAAYLDIPESRVSFNPEFLELLNHATQPVNNIKTIEGSADLWINTPDINQSLYCNIKVKRGEAIQIKGSVFLGITVLNALIRKDSIFIHNVFGGEVLVGENNPENFQRALMGLNFDFTQFTDAFLGLPSFTINPKNIEQITAEKGKVGYYIKGPEPSAIMIDSSTKAVESIQLYDSTGTKRAMANYREFKEVKIGNEKTVLPEVIEFISLPNANLGNKAKPRELIIAYTSRRLNRPDFEIDYKIPGGVRVVSLDQKSMKLLKP